MKRLRRILFALLICLTVVASPVLASSGNNQWVVVDAPSGAFLVNPATGQLHMGGNLVPFGQEPGYNVASYTILVTSDVTTLRYRWQSMDYHPPYDEVEIRAVDANYNVIASLTPTWSWNGGPTITDSGEQLLFVNTTGLQGQQITFWAMIGGTGDRSWATIGDVWAPQAWSHIQLDFRNLKRGQTVVIRENEPGLHKIYEGVAYWGSPKTTLNGPASYILSVRSADGNEIVKGIVSINSNATGNDILWVDDIQNNDFRWGNTRLLP